MPRIVFTTSGNPHRGSWIVRGKQLAAAIDAEAIFEAAEAEIAKADLVVVVKRASPQIMASIRKRGCPWVLDVLDCWPQPQGNAWSRRQSVAWLRQHVETVRPSAIVCATEAMRRDLDGIAPALTLYHHARPGLARNPIRDDVRTVGYEGSERYLGPWRKALEKHCAARGWRFVVNPKQLADLDIVVALRAGPWHGPATQHWKSNVKLANAQGSGTPIICQCDHGYDETASGGEWFIVSPEELPVAFGELSGVGARCTAAELMHRRTPMLDRIAAEYRGWLDHL